MNDGEKLTFVLPLTLQEKPAYSWRNSSDDEARLRIHFLLSSFLANFNLDDMLEFQILCPENEIDQVTEFISTLTKDPRFKIVAEQEICPDVKRAIDRKTGKFNGWFAQQLLKLAIAKRVTTDFYLTFDNDIICVKPFSAKDLISNGLALTNIETFEDYQKIYTDSYAKEEAENKFKRFQNAAKFLNYHRPEELRYRFYGETPVVLHTKSVLALTEYLTQHYPRGWFQALFERLSPRFAKTWSQVLAENLTWTEYSLYYQFLEMTGKLTFVCNLTGCNTVLDLERSAWHSSEKYRTNRTYDEVHFRGEKYVADRGFFIAMQSWLAVSSWLPPRYKSLRDFYQSLEKWVLKSGCRQNVWELS